MTDLPAELPDGRPATRAGRRRQVATTVVLVVGLAALGVAAQRAWRDAQDVSLPGAGALSVAFVSTRAALFCSARAWAGLIGPPTDPRLVAGAFYQSQLIKYVPAGGVVQAAGQVGMTAMHGVPVRRVSLAYLSLAAATVASGLTLGTGLVLVGSLATWVRALALAGLLAPVLLHHRVLHGALGLARRLSSRVPEATLLPDQRSLWVALAWCGANHVLYAGGFTVLLHAVDASTPVAAAAVAYVVAWVIGFLVLPLPSGVGVREAVLVALVPSVMTGPLLAASLAQRLVAILAEVVAAGSNRLLRLRAR